MQRSLLLGIHLLLLLFTVLSTCDRAKETEDGGGNDAERTTTIYLVRHAEKEAGEDPRLTAAGEERAQHLRKLLSGKRLSAVYSTQTQRTQMTAEPTAQDHQLDVQAYDPGDLAGFADELKHKHQGESILVVGHSNTTPALVNALSKTSNYGAISEDLFGTLYVVTLPRRGEARVAERTY